MKGSHKWGWYIPRKFASEQNYPIEAESGAEEKGEGAEEKGEGAESDWRTIFKDVPLEEIQSGKHEVRRSKNWVQLIVLIDSYHSYCSTTVHTITVHIRNI